MVEDNLKSDGEKAQVRWAIPQRVHFMTFIGRDVLAVAHDVFIIFFNLKYNTEHVYEANCFEKGDGVDVIAGYKTNTFAFAEKCTPTPRILVMTYPALKIVAELKDHEVNRYKALAMMENELLAGVSGFPQYALSVWSWRSRQRLLSIPTAVVRRRQSIVPSRTHLMIGQCWEGGINVWEVTQCHKVALVMKRPLDEATGWEVSDPPLRAICWSSDGQLYAIDENAHLYSLTFDGVGLVKQLEWSENIEGKNRTCMCTYNTGMLIYGPDNCVRVLKKSDTKWTVSWFYRPRDVVIKLVSNFATDLAIMWTEKGFVYKITTELEDNIEAKLISFKQRNIKKIQLLAPSYAHIVTLDDGGTLCSYEVMTGKLETIKYLSGEDITLQASPTDPLLVVVGAVEPNYGLALLKWEHNDLQKIGEACLTYQIISKATFSPDGRTLVVAAMSAGDVFIYNVSEDFKLSLMTYTELGRSLVDCVLMQVGELVRLFCVVLSSDQHAIGERIICINAKTGEKNKLEGKLAGPYSQLVSAGPGKILAVPHRSTQMHLLEFIALNDIVHLKMHPAINTGHELKQYNIVYNDESVLTYGYDGTAIFQHLHHTEENEDLMKLVVTHRYEGGIKEACIDNKKSVLVHLANHGTSSVHLLQSEDSNNEVTFEPPDPLMFEEYYYDSNNVITIFDKDAKNYLDEEEEKKIKEEEIASKQQRDEIILSLESVKIQLVDLLENNLQSNEPEYPQLPLSEFLLHSEYKRDRQKQAEKEREQIQIETDARIQALNKVSDWIKKHCWDVVLTPCTKLFAIFSHYQVENFAVLPTQRNNWPELQQIEALRTIEMENDSDVFRPEEEQMETISVDDKALALVSQTTEVEGWKSLQSQTPILSETEISDESNPYVLAGSTAHDLIEIPKIMIPQTMSYSFLHMNWMQHIVKLNVQNLRLWFNKEFDDLMNQKKREMSHVQNINSRLRFIVQELNTLSDLRGSYHHLTIGIQDPEWDQEEQPEKLIKVEAEEVTVPPYISPSQIVIPPPEPQPKDDFRERALMEMMDGVLEKLWHEEIKKPIQLPQCIIEKDPEHFNEDDLREVFDYEAKVAGRNEERDKYRKMLHAEYAKLSQTLNEGIVKFNQKVKDMWLTKLKVDSIIGQENLNLMRLRRINLDRVESAEKIEDLRLEISKYEAEGEMLQQELITIQSNTEQCQAIYEGLIQKEKQQEKTFKNHFVDVSPVVADQCYKFYKRRPKWQARGNLTPAALQEMATAVVTGVRPPLMHPDCLEFLKSVDQLDHISNMPPVMDETVWSTMCRLRRAKIENEIRLRAMSAEVSCAESAANVWRAGVAARRSRAARARARVLELRQATEHDARNRTLQLVMRAGQVEIVSTGHIEDFEDAILLPRDEIEEINNVILQVGELKLKLMRQQVEFRKGILAKEWEHAQMKMKLRHMEQELASYRRLKLPKELQWYLKNKMLGRTDEQEYIRMEKEIEASKVSVNRELTEEIKKVEEVELKKSQVEAHLKHLETLIGNLNAKVSEKKLNEDPLMPIKIRNVYKERMETLIMRSKLIREVQANHTRIVLLQTELELLRLKTYPTLATFRTLE
ncbi:cilia- and flagella-associated protein 43 [Aricia agestis]|uniref:cilia- and flagella-associated protein 43 n=1 Tax=Aricia agestis TaxID=91739 RepID=UPI001C202C5D|nr:cilia- and flagella-associated protein 43 [Aricia agestis]